MHVGLCWVRSRAARVCCVPCPGLRFLICPDVHTSHAQRRELPGRAVFSCAVLSSSRDRPPFLRPNFELWTSSSSQQTCVRHRHGFLYNSTSPGLQHRVRHCGHESMTATPRTLRARFTREPRLSTCARCTLHSSPCVARLLLPALSSTITTRRASTSRRRATRTRSSPWTPR